MLVKLRIITFNVYLYLSSICISDPQMLCLQILSILILSLKPAGTSVDDMIVVWLFRYLFILQTSKMEWLARGTRGQGCSSCILLDLQLSTVIWELGQFLVYSAQPIFCIIHQPSLESETSKKIYLHLLLAYNTSLWFYKL